MYLQVSLFLKNFENWFEKLQTLQCHKYQKSIEGPVIPVCQRNLRLIGSQPMAKPNSVLQVYGNARSTVLAK